MCVVQTRYVHIRIREANALRPKCLVAFGLMMEIRPYMYGESNAKPAKEQKKRHILNPPKETKKKKNKTEKLGNGLVSLLLASGCVWIRVSM